MDFTSSVVYVSNKVVPREGKKSLNFVTLSDGFQSVDFMVDEGIKLDTLKKGDTVKATLTFEGKYSKITSLQK